MRRGAAVFDFDKTLIRQESMGMFLRAVAGERFASACCAAGAKAAAATPGRRRDAFRFEMLRRMLAGKTIAEAHAAAERVFARLEWISWTMQELHRHRDEGRRILVATGSLSVYMPAILEMKGIQVDSLLSTEIAVDGDVLTGEMVTPSCTWTEKARRVKEWRTGVEGALWGYGNLPHDRAMLAITDHPTAVPI
jgi:HAD superfamily phosphoserine phosphatase-like hydrolase